MTFIGVGVGLYCRAVKDCSFRAIPNTDTVPAIKIAAGMRDEHEREAHAYHHQQDPVPSTLFRGFTRAGKSTIARLSKA